MYADRYARPEGIKPGSLTVAIAINAAVVGALMFSVPIVTAVIEKPPLVTRNIPVDPPPEPLPIEQKAQPQQRTRATPERIETTKAIGAPTDDFTGPPLLPLPPLDPGVYQPPLADPPVAPPVLTGATLDPRYVRDLQPAYPAGERRAEREGSVQLRVTIGADGRVSRAECVTATSDAFCRATIAQSLAKWRFKPATRDGVAVETQQVKTVRFELES